MSATRVSGMSHDTTRIFLAILCRAFPPESRKGLSVASALPRDCGSLAPMPRENRGHPMSFARTSRNGTSLCLRAPPRHRRRTRQRGPLRQDVKVARTPKRAAGGRTFGTRGPGQSHVPRYPALQIPETGAPGQPEDRQRPRHTLPRYRCSLPGLAGFTLPRRQGRTGLCL